MRRSREGEGGGGHTKEGGTFPPSSRWGDHWQGRRRRRLLCSRSSLSLSCFSLCMLDSFLLSLSVLSLSLSLSHLVSVLVETSFPLPGEERASKRLRSPPVSFACFPRLIPLPIREIERRKRIRHHGSQSRGRLTFCTYYPTLCREADFKVQS